MTGVYQCSKNEMLAYFSEQLTLYSGQKQARPKTWFEAFSQLRAYLSTLLEEREQIIIFIDELPWLDTPKSNFIRALDLFWNGWASDQPNIKFIVCGSATTWMTNKLLGDKGGLHNRVTRKIYLAPFDLNETELFLQSKGIVWTRHQIAECYMIMGGTPFYLNMIDKQYSLPQNIDMLFSQKAQNYRMNTNSCSVHSSRTLYFTAELWNFLPRKDGYDERRCDEGVTSRIRRKTVRSI